MHEGVSMGNVWLASACGSRSHSRPRSISALFCLTNHISSQDQYTNLVTGVIGSAVVPTVIAQR
jgi:hypothetical protein